MKKKLLSIIAINILLLAGSSIFAQEEKESDKRSVRPTFESTLLIDNQSVMVQTAKTLEFDIMHRFGTLDKGFEDLFGFFAPSNIRFGLSYSPIDKLNIGTGITKFNKYLDFSAKYAILMQTRDWSVPVSLTYYGNVAIDTRASSNFDKEIHRYSFFHELIIASRISSKISIQIAPSFSHFNAVDSLLVNDIIAISTNGRYKISPQSSFIFEFTQQLNQHDGKIDLQPNINFGLEVSTSSHAFQIFAGTFQGILPQHNILFNENKFKSSGIIIGFNITRLWNF